MHLKKRIYDHSLVINGSFNPRIFQPLWFASEDLIGKNEAEDADVKIIHPDISDFEIGKGISIRVTREQFIASTSQDGFFEILKDLVIGTFSILSHTPTTALGINQEMHIELSKTTSWKSYNSKVVNAKYWSEAFGEAIMDSITYSRERKDNKAGYQRIALQPSIKVFNGLLFSFNDHFELEAKNINNAIRVIEIIEDSWQASIATGQELIENLLEKTEHDRTNQ